MVLVLLGTQNNSFHRLLEEIDRLIQSGIIQEEVIVQAGYTQYTSENMKLLGLIAKEELEDLQNKADFIITHGGVGSILLSITKNKKVIAVPRLHLYGEHVNDHQKQIVGLFNEKGYILGVEGVERLGEAIKKVEDFEPKKYQQNHDKMLKIIEDFIETC